MKNLRTYWPLVVLITALLAVQAYFEMAMPTYTQDIIDTGIQNRGIEHILPAKIKPGEYKQAQMFMNASQKKRWQDSYTKKKDVYVPTASDAALEKADDKLLTPIVLTYQLGHTSPKQFKTIVKRQMKAAGMANTPMMAQVDQLSVKQLADQMHMNVRVFKAEDENGKAHTYVDIRSAMQGLIDSGQMSAAQLSQMKKQINKTIDTVGPNTLKSMAIRYSYETAKNAGVPVRANQVSYLWASGGRMALMAVGMLIAAILVAYLASRVGAGVGRDLRDKVFGNVITYSNAELDQFQTSSLITRATNDVQQVQQVTTMMLRMVLYAPVLAIWGIVKVYQTHANMSWVIILGIAVIMGVMFTLMRIALPKFKIMQKLVDALNGVSREMLTGLMVVRAFGRQKKEEERFDEANTELMQTQLFTNRVMTFLMPGMIFIMNGLAVLITWVASHRVNTGVMQVGTMTAFITYAMIIVSSFMIITAMSIILPRAGVAAERIDEVARTTSSIQNRADATELTRGAGEVRFDHVDFQYPGADRNVLTDIDFTAKPGKVTAIIGSTGSGKSTLANLIPRFYDVTGGHIFIDGKDIRDVTMHSLREQIGFVQQKGVLFSGTIASNIRFGAEDATDAEVTRAAQIAQADEFIDQKDDGYDSPISQGGGNVSGGQKQRLAIARAIAKKPEILVFDDSFSALDMKTDAKLRKVLAKEAGDTTRIIVAQRIGTIVDADQIIVLDEGHIAGKGTHDELMQTCKVYQEIAKSQLSDEELKGMA